MIHLSYQLRSQGWALATISDGQTRMTCDLRASWFESEAVNVAIPRCQENKPIGDHRLAKVDPARYSVSAGIEFLSCARVKCMKRQVTDRLGMNTGSLMRVLSGLSCKYDPVSYDWRIRNP